jgi:hypothetical protein
MLSARHCFRYWKKAMSNVLISWSLHLSFVLGFVDQSTFFVLAFFFAWDTLILHGSVLYFPEAIAQMSSY